MAYATRDDVFQTGLSAVAFVSRPRPVDATNVDTSTGTIKLKGHGMFATDRVLLEQVARGSLPVDGFGASLSGFVYYTPLSLGGDLFQLIDPATGIAFTFTDAGSGWGVTIDPMRRLDVNLEVTAGEIDECLTGELPPIKPDPISGLYPWTLRGMNARMAALRTVGTLQVENAEARIAVDRILAQDKIDDVTRADWKAGKPLNPRPIDQDNIATNGARAGNSRSGSGWTTGMI